LIWTSAAQTWIAHETNHLDLLSRRGVPALREWLAA